VWLTDEEDKGYYEGFSTKGCGRSRMLRTRVLFFVLRIGQYQKSRRFADAVLQEMEGVESPILLAQDYHFALLPRMIRMPGPMRGLRFSGIFLAERGGL